MAGINFRTESTFLDVTATSASTSGSPNNANTLFTCPASHVCYFLPWVPGTDAPQLA